MGEARLSRRSLVSNAWPGSSLVCLQHHLGPGIAMGPADVRVVEERGHSVDGGAAPFGRTEQGRWRIGSRDIDAIPFQGLEEEREFVVVVVKRRSQIGLI